MTATEPVRYLTIRTIARAVGRAATRLRELEAQGAIPQAGRLDGSATRVYRPEDVDVIRQALAALPRRREQAV